MMIAPVSNKKLSQKQIVVIESLFFPHSALQERFRGNIANMKYDKNRSWSMYIRGKAKDMVHHHTISAFKKNTKYCIHLR